MFRVKLVSCLCHGKDDRHDCRGIQRLCEFYKIEGEWAMEVVTVSKPSWISLRNFSRQPMMRRFQWSHSMGVIKVNHNIKLLQEFRLEVVADSFGERTIHDTNGAFQK